MNTTKVTSIHIVGWLTQRSNRMNTITYENTLVNILAEFYTQYHNILWKEQPLEEQLCTLYYQKVEEECHSTMVCLGV